MLSQHENRWHSFVASASLVAVLLLYAPFGGAAWALYSAACCKLGSQCPIHGHHHTQTPANSEHAMDCGHDMAGMAQCNMSCCQNPERPAVAPAIFVLPPPVTVSFSNAYEPFVALPLSQVSSHSFEPLSPPPRFSTLAA